MKNSLRKRIANKFLQIASHIYPGNDVFPGIQSQRVKIWKKNFNYTEIRTDYKLNEKSVVFDLGGFRGDWAQQIADRYNCSIYIFEPMAEYYKGILTRLGSNPKVQIFNFGIGETDKEAMLSIDEESSSVYGAGVKEKIVIKRASDFFFSNSIKQVDLMKINIEGSEYDLLEHLLDSNLTSSISNIQVQFHDFVPNANLRMALIQQKLSKTHFLTYQQEFVWENWQLKSNI